MPRNPGNHDVYVVYDPDPDPNLQGFRVIPPVAVVSKNVSIRNLSGYDVEISCAALNVPPTLIGDGKHGGFAVGAAGIYAYDVTAIHKGVRKRAKGNSDPKVIVDA